jgi:hypothetical protein
MIVITYGELVLMCLGVGILWAAFIYIVLCVLERWGVLKRED